MRPPHVPADHLAVGPERAVLSFAGEIDLGTEPAFRKALLPALARGTGSVVVDLSDVPFMDSTGVHVLVDTLGLLQERSRGLAIVCREGGQVHRLLALLGLLDVLTVHGSRESALNGGADRLRPAPGRERQPSDTRSSTRSPLSSRRPDPCADLVRKH